MDNAVSVALTPVQLAAVLSDKSITESETLGNRLWGSLEFVLGVAEMAGATALCAAPEPTGLTKVGCIAVGAHSMDTIKTASHRVMTGSNARTATSQIASQLARKLGADESTAANIGVAVDVAVPLGFAGVIGAARVASVQSGRIRLIQHESRTGFKPGGHTIQRHVGKSKDDLLQRLSSSPRLRGASTFENINIAEKAITSAIRSNSKTIKTWGLSPHRKLELEYTYKQTVGYYIKNGSTDIIHTSKIKVILEQVPYNGKPYYILTAFPTW